MRRYRPSGDLARHACKIARQSRPPLLNLRARPPETRPLRTTRARALWFLTTRGWVITRRFTSVVSLTIPLSQSRLSHRGLLRPPQAATRRRRRLAFCIGMRETFVTPDHRRPLLECGAVPGAVAA